MALKYGRVLNWVRGPSAPLKYSTIRVDRMKPLPVRCSLKDLESPVHDQGQAGSCTSFAIASALEYNQLREKRLNIKGPEQFSTHYDPISEMFIYFNERWREGNMGIDAGAMIYTGITSIAAEGFCRASMWPYDLNYLYIQPTQAAYTEAAKHRNSTGYTVTTQSEIKASIVDGYPVVFGTELCESFMRIGKSGVYHGPEDGEQPIGGHALLIVGYDDKYKSFTVKNSWGTGFGDKGYCYLSYDFALGFSDLHTIR